MFSIFRNRLGIPGVISVIALVFAMFGGAYAASSSGGGATATQAKKKLVKGPRGPRGPIGLTGPAGAKGDPGPIGPQGPAGANGTDGTDGANGTDGDDGTDGTDGTNGTDGTSVTNETEPTGTANCQGLGGSKFKVGAGPTTFACNGETGFTATLPPGETETGAWGTTVGPEEAAYVGIPFPIPLADELDEDHVHIMQEGENGVTGCTGGTASDPKADEGHLCVYVSSSFEGELTGAAIFKAGGGALGTGTSGAILLASGPAGEIGFGTYAVTAAGP